MSATYPLINEWKKEGLKWKYIFSPKYQAMPIPAGGALTLPQSDFIYNYPEGILIFFTAGFDHPTCGIRLEWGPEFDSQEFFTVNTMSLGLANVIDPLVYTMIPPLVPPGIYAIRVASPYVWEENLRLRLINTDTVEHKCLGFGYMMAVLTEKRPPILHPIIALDKRSDY